MSAGSQQGVCAGGGRRRLGVGERRAVRACALRTELPRAARAHVSGAWGPRSEQVRAGTRSCALSLRPRLMCPVVPRTLAAGVPRPARQSHPGVRALQQRRRPRVPAAAREPGAAAGGHGPGERHLQVRGGERHGPRNGCPLHRGGGVSESVPSGLAPCWAPVPCIPSTGSLSDTVLLVWLQAP